MAYEQSICNALISTRSHQVLNFPISLASNYQQSQQHLPTDILPRDEFIEVRTSRSKHCITSNEQTHLSRKRIGVIGLSVGATTELTLAMEGFGGELRVADFDVLGLSNLNRLREGIANVGVNKAVLCAREILELNPYLDVKVFEGGLDEGNVEEFVCGSEESKLHLIVEECDDLPVKVLARERPRYHRIPVIMETSDKGMLDIERFNLEPDQPLFHNLMGGDMDPKKLRVLSLKDKMEYQLSGQ